MAIFYGSDSYCLDDVLLIDTQVTDPRVLIGQRLIRRLTTPPGALALINDVADGFDVRQFINAKISPGTIAIAQAQIADECLKDQQVQTADVEMTLAKNGNLSINIGGLTAAGPFSLTMNVSQLTTEVVFNF
jgi:hypothetical protein